MKKLIGTVAALLLVASAAFADITFGAWLRVLGAPLASDGDETIYAGMTNSWGYGARAARLDVNAVSDDGNAGFSFGIYNDVWSGFSNGGTCALWVKPLDMLKVSLGQWDYTAVRGDFCYGSWNWLHPNNAVAWGEGMTFPQLGNQAGMLLELTPIDGLLVIWNLPLAQLHTTSTQEAYEVFEKQHIAATYAIENIGKIHLGWAGNGSREWGQEAKDGGWDFKVKDKDGKTVLYSSIAAAEQAKLDASKTGSTDKNDYSAMNTSAGTWVKAVGSADEYKYLGDISVAFDLTAVENLYVTVGGTFGIASSDYKKKCTNAFRNAQFALGASYKVMDNFTVYGDFAMALYDSDRVDDPAMSFGIGLDFGAMDNLTLNVDFRGYMPNNNMDPSFSFLIGAQYACSSNGYIGIGFQGLICGEKANILKPADKASLGGFCPVYPATADKFSFAVPIAVSVWF